MSLWLRNRAIFPLLILAFFLFLILVLHAQNQVLGEIELVGASKVENTSGVWIDGQYIGYLSELKGSKKLLLLPGEHYITVRQGGSLDFFRQVSVRAAEKQTIAVKMEKDTRVQMPRVTAEVKLDVKPTRAAVFVDGVFIGHIAEFTGIGKALLVEPGKRKIKISLPGYQPARLIYPQAISLLRPGYPPGNNPAIRRVTTRLSAG